MLLPYSCTTAGTIWLKWVRPHHSSAQTVTGFSSSLNMSSPHPPAALALPLTSPLTTLSLPHCPPATVAGTPSYRPRCSGPSIFALLFPLPTLLLLQVAHSLLLKAHHVSVQIPHSSYMKWQPPSSTTLYPSHPASLFFLALNSTWNDIYLFIYWLLSPECELYKVKDFVLLPTVASMPRRVPAHNKCSITICQTNEWIKGFKDTVLI